MSDKPSKSGGTSPSKKRHHSGGSSASSGSEQSDGSKKQRVEECEDCKSLSGPSRDQQLARALCEKCNISSSAPSSPASSLGSEWEAVSRASIRSLSTSRDSNTSAEIIDESPASSPQSFQTCSSPVHSEVSVSSALEHIQLDPPAARGPSPTGSVSVSGAFENIQLGSPADREPTPSAKEEIVPVEGAMEKAEERASLQVSRGINISLPFLLPYEWDSLWDALEIFNELFRSRYGDRSPNFQTKCLATVLINSLTENIKRAGKKGLLVYLHNDHAVASNVFPSEILCAPEMASLLRNFYIWGWDLTRMENRKIFFNWLQDLEILELWSDVITMPMRSYPLLVVMADVGGLVMPVNVLDGAFTKSAAIDALLPAPYFS